MNNTLGIPEDEWKRLAEKRRTENFLMAWRHPGMWKFKAYNHKHAADILYEIGFGAFEREQGLISAMMTLTDQKIQIKEEQNLQSHNFYNHELLSEFFLLSGYALECLTKGYLLSLLPELVSENRVEKIILNHDLPELFYECGISIQQNERELLQLITRYVVWGKYGAPIYKKDMPSWIDPDDQVEKSLAVSNPYHDRRVQKIVNDLYMRVYLLLDEQCKRNLS